MTLGHNFCADRQNNSTVLGTFLNTFVMSDSNELDWSPEMEVNLFFALKGLKPVGVDKHFQMMLLRDRLMERGSLKAISCKDIWKQLSTLYDLNALAESEGLRFPNAENDFLLPEDFTVEQSVVEEDNRDEGPGVRRMRHESRQSTPEPPATSIPPAITAKSAPAPSRKRTRLSAAAGTDSPSTPAVKRRR